MAKAAPSTIISHWYTLIENLQASPKEFYKSLEEAIKKRQVPHAKTGRIDWKEGGIFSAKREYLQVRRKPHLFDICGAPFGNGFFVSWWLGENRSRFMDFLLSLPILGPMVEALFRPMTYYKIDTALMFQQAIHGAVLEVVDSLTEAKGVRALSEDERKPILKDFHKR